MPPLQGERTSANIVFLVIIIIIIMFNYPHLCKKVNYSVFTNTDLEREYTFHFIYGTGLHKF